MPLSAILSVTAEDLTVILLGDKWRVAGSLLSIIALRGIFQVIEGSQGWLHLAIGRADRWRNWGVVSLLVQVAAVLGGVSFGPRGVATALVIAFLLLAMPSIIYAGRPIGIGAAFAIRAVGAQLVGAISIAVAGWWYRPCFSPIIPVQCEWYCREGSAPAFTLPLLLACFGLPSRLGSSARLCVI